MRAVVLWEERVILLRAEAATFDLANEVIQLAMVALDQGEPCGPAPT